MKRLQALLVFAPRVPGSPRGQILAVGIALVLVVAMGVVSSVLRAERSAAEGPHDDSRLARDAAVRAARDRAVVLARARTPRGLDTPHSLRVRARVADSSHAGALFAMHSWYVAPPPSPPVAPAPPPPPEAPPFPYAFVGSYAPIGEQPVYFLSRADRVIDAHVGDRLDGVYEFESAGPGNLVFNYLPLNIRQSVPTGVAP